MCSSSLRAKPSVWYSHIHYLDLARRTSHPRPSDVISCSHQGRTSQPEGQDETSDGCSPLGGLDLHGIVSTSRILFSAASLLLQQLRCFHPGTVSWAGCVLAAKQLEHLETRNLLQALLYRQSTWLSSSGVASYSHQTLNHFRTLLGTDRSHIAWGELYCTQPWKKQGRDIARAGDSPYPGLPGQFAHRNRWQH